MQKHGVILDMSCDKLAFWLGHCQHLGFMPLMVNTPVELYLSTSAHISTSAIILLAPHVKNLTTSVTAPVEPQKSKKSKKSKPIKIPSAIPDVWPAYQGVSKLTDSEGKKYVVTAKHILKSATTPKPTPPIDEIKLLDLAFIAAAAFQYLAK